MKIALRGGWTGEVVAGGSGGCLSLCLADGSTEDISYRKCLWPPGSTEPLRRDLRKAIVDDIRAFAAIRRPPSARNPGRPPSVHTPCAWWWTIDHRWASRAS